MKRLAVVVLAALALPTGCGGSGGDTKKAVVSNGGTYTVSYETSPAAIPMNEPFTVVFRVSPPSGDPKVEIDARMPAHGHGMNRAPKISKTADGAFKAEGMLFHMPGHWEMYFDISQGGRSERAQVDVNLK